MNINDSMVPDNLMDNVEARLKKHVQQKKKRRKIYSAAFAIIFAIIIPTSVFAYNSYFKSIPYKQEVDLARENNNISKLDKVFKYKDIKFNLKEIIADETGILVLYDVSNPNYFIKSLNFTDANNHYFDSWGYSTLEPLEPQTERAFHIAISKDTLKYMKDNSVIIKIDKLDCLENANNSLLEKSKSLIGKDKNLAVDWTIKAKIPLQETRVTKLNKEIKLDIGTLKLTAFKEGVLKSYVNYEFIPSDKSITSFNPIFSVRMDNEYYNKNITDIITLQKSIEFKSTYYKKPKEIGLTLIGAQVRYSNENKKEYTISKENLPAEYDFNGDKFRLISAKEVDDSMEYSFESNTTDRSYGDINLHFNGDFESRGHADKILYKDKAERDSIYTRLSSKIPNFKELYSVNQLDKGNVKYTYKVNKKFADKFTVHEYEKGFIYDTEEYVINP